mgnify:CR=1 FL=1
MGMHLGVDVVYGLIIQESDLYGSDMTVRQAVQWDGTKDPQVYIERPNPEDTKDRRFFLYLMKSRRNIAYHWDIDPRNLVYFRDFPKGTDAGSMDAILRSFCEKYRIPFGDPGWALHWYVR